MDSLEILPLTNKDLEVDDIVHVQIIDKSDIGLNVEILNYPGKTGFIPITDMVKRRVKKKSSLNKDNTFFASVLDVSPSIVLSRKHVASKQIQKNALDNFETRIYLRKVGYSIYLLYLKYLETKNIQKKIKAKDVLDNSVWYALDNILDNINDDDYNVSNDTYNLMLSQYSNLFNKDYFEEEFIEKTIKILNDRTTKTETEMTQTINIFSLININNIIKCFDLVKEHFKEDTGIKYEIKFDSPGKYNIIMSHLDENIISNNLTQIIELIKLYCKKERINFRSSEEPFMSKIPKINLNLITQHNINSVEY